MTNFNCPKTSSDYKNEQRGKEKNRNCLQCKLYNN